MILQTERCGRDLHVEVENDVSVSINQVIAETAIVIRKELDGVASLEGGCDLELSLRAY